MAKKTAVLLTKELVELAELLRLSYQEVIDASRDRLGKAVVHGGYLLRAKKLIGHGDFGGWLEDNGLDLSTEQQRRYMRLAKHWPAIEAALQGLPEGQVVSIRGALELVKQPKRSCAPTLSTKKPKQNNKKPSKTQARLPLDAEPRPEFDGYNQDAGEAGSDEPWVESGPATPLDRLIGAWNEASEAERKEFAKALNQSDAAKCIVCGKSKAKRSVFEPPTLEEVGEYCRQRGNGVEPQRFLDYYEARGWKLKGGQSVKSWQACVRTWESNGFSPKPGSEESEAELSEKKRREKEVALQKKIQAERAGRA